MFDMNSHLVCSIHTTKPPPGPDKLIPKILELLKKEECSLYKSLINEDHPRIQFCYPITLIEDDITLEFIKLHTLIPEKTQNYPKNYQSADDKCNVELSIGKLFYSINKEEKKQKEILETKTYYTSYFNTIDIILIPNSFLIEKIEELTLDSVERIHPKTIPLKEYKTYSQQHAKVILEQSFIELLSTKKGQEIYKDFLFQLNEGTSKFTKQLNKFSQIEFLKVQKNNNNLQNGSIRLQSLNWASKQVRLLQTHYFLSFMAITDHSDSPVTQFSHIYQPLEE